MFDHISRHRSSEKSEGEYFFAELSGVWKFGQTLFRIFLRSRYENATLNLCWVFCAFLGVLCDKYKITYKPAHGSATQVTEINKLNQNTEKVNEVSCTHIPLTALMNDSLKKCDFGKCRTIKFRRL